MRFNQDSIQKSTEVRCVCCTLNLSLYKCWSMVFLRYETPVEFHAFGFHVEQVWQEFWGEIFRMRFLVALIMPQTASIILRSSEGCSCKTRGSGYIPFSSQNEELAYTRFHNSLTFWDETWIYAKMISSALWKIEAQNEFDQGSIRMQGTHSKGGFLMS